MRECYHKTVYVFLPLEMDRPSKDQVLFEKRRDLKISLEI